MSEREGEGRADELVRRLAESIASDDGPTVVALLADPDAPEASWRQAGRLCDAVASRRRTLVVNLAGAGSGFDRFLGLEDGDGLEGVRAGRIKLSQAPVQIEGRRFLYLPAGRPDPAAADEGGLPLEDSGVVGAVEKLAEKIRQAGGALLLYLTPDALPDRHTADLMDGAVRLAGAVGVGGVRTLGHLDVGEVGPDESVEDFLGLPTEPEGDAEPGAEPTGPGPETPEEESAPELEAEARPEPEAPSASEAEPAREGASAAGEPPSGEAPAPEPGEAEPEEAPGAAPEAPGSAPEGPEPEETAVGGPPPRLADTAAGRGEEEPDGRPATGAVAGPGAGGGGGEDEGEASDWRRHRRSSPPPWGKIALGVVVVFALVGGWWYLTGRAGPGAADAGGERTAAAAEPADVAGEGVGASGDDAAPADAAADTAPGEAAGALALVERSPELTYSVLVASFGSWSAARERLDRWGGEQGAPVLFAAPTPVRDRVYWRIFAGALAERGAGEQLNRDLVDRGWKEEATAWEIRPASLAFRVAAETTREAAERRVSDLRQRDVPAYALPAAAGGDTAWAVWSGAYESREDAAGLGDRLREAGVEAELVTRRGAPGAP